MNKTGLLGCLLLLLLFSCGDSQKKFKIEGSFKGFNQGDLYIYGLNGTHQLDTIRVSRGEFSYQLAINEPTTLVVVFPNYSEIPVFAESGVTIKMKGDASHLKETEVTGTELNKEMTSFRLRTSNMMPPAVLAEASKFIKEHLKSPISLYLLNRLFIQTAAPDYVKAQELGQMMQKAMPDNGQLEKLCKLLEGLKGVKVGSHLPSFSTTGLKGERVSSSDLNAKVNVLTLWSSWNYESINIQNMLSRLQKQHPGKLKVLSVSIDGSIKDCQKIVERDSIQWSTICDGRMWESSILQKVGMTYLPDNIVVDDQGKILARTLNYQELNKKIEELIE